jgi:hypothetical protein
MKNIDLTNAEKITTGFVVSDAFFEQFSEKVLHQTTKNSTVKVISFHKKVKKWSMSVAAILVLTLSLPIAYHIQNNASNELSNDEVEHYLIHHTTLTDDDVINALDQKDIEQLKVSKPIEHNVIEETLSTNSDLEYYITNETN